MMGVPSDRVKKMVEQANEPAETLVITMNRAGMVSVNGPIDKKIMCFGMLKAAELAIASFDPGKSKQVVIPKLVMDGKPQG